MTVSLAQTAPFTLGPLQVVPAAREVTRGDRSQSIEPLVMQVFIVLARSVGEVVSRDSLIERCWGGRAISEDALNRVIAKVRRIDSVLGGGAFHLETVTKVGYRLRIDGTSGPTLPAPSPQRLYRRVLPAFALLICIGALALFLSPRDRPAPIPAAPAVQPREASVAAAADLETRGLSLLFQGSAQETESGLSFLRQATALAPRRASLWGSLAMGYVLALSHNEGQSAQADVDRALEAADRALALDPRQGRAIAARIALTPTFGHWAQKDALLRQGARQAAAETAPLVFQRAQYLASVGRSGEALEQIDRLDAISPLLPWIQSLRAHLLAAQGRPGAAQQVADRASALWPRDRLTWFTRFDLALFGGRPRDALALGEDRTSWPAGSEADIADRMAIAHLLVTPSSKEAIALIDQLEARGETDRTAAETAVQAAVALDQPDRALAIARRMYRNPGVLAGRGVVMPRIGADDGHERNTALLFWPLVARLRDQSEHKALVHELAIDR